MTLWQQAMDLSSEVDAQLKNVHTQGLDISFNELLDMVNSKELNISPDYQRLFRWSTGAQSRFIESLLLEMPVPPLYVVEEDNNNKLLIDGLQRLSSYLHFRGALEAPHLRPPVKSGEYLRLHECDILTSLNGKTFEDLGTPLQIKLKRSFVRVEVVRKGSNPKFRYHMFKRLNTGGEALTQQQMRNCTIRLLNDQFIEFINSLAQNADAFKTCISSISDEQLLGAYDKELVLRFFALKNARQTFSHDVSDFLTSYMEAVSEGTLPFDKEFEQATFIKTFSLLAKTLGENAFSRANTKLTGLVRGFGVYHFEAFTIGIQKVIDLLSLENTTQLDQLREVLMGIKLDKDFVDLTTGGGKNSPGPLNDRISFVERKVSAMVR